MGLKLVAPARRKDSSRLRFEQRIPADLKARLIGMTLEVPRGGGVVPITITPTTVSIRFSLGTSDESEAKRRQAEAIAYLESVYGSLRANRPLPLTHQQCVALSGVLYRAWAADLEASPNITIQNEADGTETLSHGLDADDFEALAAGAAKAADWAERLDGGNLEQRLGPLADRLLIRNGITNLEPRSRGTVLMEFSRALADGLRARARKAQGEYQPDPNAERFPVWTPPGEQRRERAMAVSLRGLFGAWWKEAESAGRSVSSKESYGTAIEALVSFLGHDDAGRVSVDDVVRFKDHLVSATNPRTKKPLSPKTIKDSYLAGLRAVFEWAVVNNRLPANPARSVKVAVHKRKRFRDPWFTEAERKALLEQASSAERGPKEPRERFEGRRWVPWLCAYTGARVGEMVQLRKQDVRQEGEHWVISITPEAGTVKSGARRDVPIHAHLIKMGFLDFVSTAPEVHLFLWSGTGRKARRTAKNRLVEVAREVVPDRGVAPNHGWRHTFRVIGTEAGLQERTVEAIGGWRPRTVGESYGGVTVAAKVGAMKLFPRFDAKPLPKVP